MLKLRVVWGMAFFFLMSWMVSRGSVNSLSLSVGEDENKMAVDRRREKKSVVDLNARCVPPLRILNVIDSLKVTLGCDIVLRPARISTTLNVRPTLKSLFTKPEQRKYIIRINNRKNFKGILLHEVPEVAQVGLWHHELMHIRDYHSRSWSGLIERGVQYLSKKGKRNFEYEIDRMVIENGYGYYLYQWSRFSMIESNASEEYKEYKRMIYLSPLQIQSILRFEIPVLQQTPVIPCLVEGL